MLRADKVAAVVLGLCLPAWAAANESVFESITSGMQYYSDVATATKANESYQPYVISVFRGEELERLGIADLEEALMLVPGVDMATDNFNNRTPIFRGSNPMAYGQTKLFIDGISANNVFFDAYNEHLKMPVELIKRIEVVRGPGSKTDGFNAFAGSINVITYAERIEGFDNRDKLLFKAGSYNYRMGGFVSSYSEGDFTLTTDFYYQRDDKRLYAGPDGLSQGVLSVDALGIDNRGISIDGDAYLWSKSHSLGVSLNYKGLYAKFRMLDHTQASAYGINMSLQAYPEDRLKQPNHYVELGLEKSLGDFDVSVKAGVKYDSFDSDAHLVASGFTFFDYLNYFTNPEAFDWATRITFPEGTYGQHLAKQRTLYHSAYAGYTGMENHALRVGYHLVKEETVAMYSRISDWLTGELAPVDYTELLPFMDANAERLTQVLSFQDTYTVSPNLSLLFGFNYEQNTFDDAGFEPRVSLVYQRDPSNIYKLIYSEAHRNPSWQELFTQYNASRWGNMELKPERVKAYEAAYIHKFSVASHLQWNFFFLQNSDEINNKALDELFKNSQSSEIFGFEVEYKGSITRNDTLYLNLSHLHGKDNDDEALANVAQNMFKGYYSYAFGNGLSASTVVRWGGEKERLEYDSRDALDGYLKVDATLRYADPAAGYHVTASTKNLFDADIRFPSVPNSYIEDYTQEGRTYMLTFGKEF